MNDKAELVSQALKEMRCDQNTVKAVQSSDL